MKDIDKSIDKEPPYNLKAEQSILGSILQDNSSINTAMEILDKSDFYSEAHRDIFFAMIELSVKNEPVDLITLSNVLENKNMLYLVGGASYLASLMDGVPSTLNVSNYARIVKEKALFRELYCAAKDIMNNCLETGSDIDQVLDNAQQRIHEISGNNHSQCFYSIESIIKNSFHTIEKLYASKEYITGVATGFEQVDDLICGLQQSDLIIIAGYPRMGKTAFALDIARFAVIELQIPVAIFSMDNSKEQLAYRLLASEAKIDAQRLRKGFLGETDWPKLTTAAERFSVALLYIDDTPAMSVFEMKAKSRRMKDENGLGLIVVDYMQLMRIDSHGNNREQEISEIIRSLKALAMELKIPIVALSLLNHKHKDRISSRTQMLDLRDSGVIEQDADVIAFIYRDEFNNKSDDNPQKGMTEIIVAKQKNGPTGTVKLKFMDKFMRFENLAKGDSNQ